MKKNNEIVEKLSTYIQIEDSQIAEKEMYIDNITFKKIRDKIVGLGKILEEDTEKQIYVITVMTGFANMNMAFVGMQLKNNLLIFVGYAKEGLINQHTSEKAIAKVIKRMK